MVREHAKGSGYTEIHVRKRTPDPLAGATLARAELEKALGSKVRVWGLHGQTGKIQDGFAFADAEALVYGVERDGTVTVLGIHGFIDDVVQKLWPLARRHQLLLVDWRRAEVIPYPEKDFSN